MNPIPAILEVLKLAERLKYELRHSWLSNGRQESVAEHTYQMALMAVLLHPHLEQPVDLCHTLKLVLVHDLVEAEAGDVPYFETGTRKAQKTARENAAIETIRTMLPAPSADDVFALWHEFEARKTGEAKFANALDKLEVQVQHNLADFSTWETVEYGLVYSKMDGPCAHDAFLRAFCEAVKEDAEQKMTSAGIDVSVFQPSAL